MVVVLGWHGHKNVGDDCYRLAFPAVFPGVDFHFAGDLAGAPAARTLVLGGGNVCSPEFLKAALSFRGSRHAVSVGVTRADPAAALRDFDSVWVRDDASRDVLANAGVPCRQAPDLAFALRPDRAAGVRRLADAFRAAGHDLYHKKVAVVVNAYLCTADRPARDEAAFQKACYDLARTFDDTAASFVFVPFGQGAPHDDRVANGWCAARCKFWKKNLAVFEPLPPQAVLDLLAACDAVVSTRLHASIFAAVAGVPFVDLTHHDKNAGFLRSIGKAGWSVPYWDFERKRFALLLNDFLADGRGDYGLPAVVDSCRGELGRMARALRLA